MVNDLHTRLSSLAIDEVAEIAALAFRDMRDGAESVLNAALSVLENKMTDADFTRFCYKLAS